MDKKTYGWIKNIFGSLNKNFVPLINFFFENNQTILLDKPIFFWVYHFDYSNKKIYL